MSVAVTLMAVGISVLSGSTAQAATIQPNYTCGSVVRLYGPLGNIRLMASNCTGPAGFFDRGTINASLVCRISAFAHPDGKVSILATPHWADCYRSQ